MSKKKTVIIIHGWSTTVDNLKPLTEKLSDFNVVTPKLKGHYGTKPDDFVKPSWKDWLNQCDEVVRDTVKKEGVDNIIIAGFSMGGVIATILSITHHIEKLVLMSPAFYIRRKEAYLAPFLKFFVKYIKNSEPDNSDPEKNVYRSYTWIEPLSDLVKISNYAKRIVKNVKLSAKKILTISYIGDGSVTHKYVDFITDNAAPHDSTVRHYIYPEGEHELLLHKGKYQEDLLNTIVDFIKE